MTLLELRGLKVRYGRIEAIHDMSITVEKGEVVSLIGANGAGKTTGRTSRSSRRTSASGSGSRRRRRAGASSRA
jgi:branched-chain amino acid transport system ATP-binding protein